MTDLHAVWDWEPAAPPPAPAHAPPPPPPAPAHALSARVASVATPVSDAAIEPVPPPVPPPTGDGRKRGGTSDGLEAVHVLIVFLVLSAFLIQYIDHLHRRLRRVEQRLAL